MPDRQRVTVLEQALAESKRVESELRASEQKYRSLVEGSPYCIKLK